MSLLLYFSYNIPHMIFNVFFRNDLLSYRLSKPMAMNVYNYNNNNNYNYYCYCISTILSLYHDVLLL